MCLLVKPNGRSVLEFFFSCPPPANPSLFQQKHKPSFLKITPGSKSVSPFDCMSRWAGDGFPDTSLGDPHKTAFPAYSSIPPGLFFAGIGWNWDPFMDKVNFLRDLPLTQ